MDRKMISVLAVLCMCSSCEFLDNNSSVQEGVSPEKVYLEDVAKLFSELPISSGQMQEVKDAVSASSGNGYDEEYTMKDLFGLPGKGVGDLETKAAGHYELPLRDMLREHVLSTATRASAPGASAPGASTSGSSTSGSSEDFPVFDEAFLQALMDSDLQIYWPYSEDWDGKTLPVITFDPETNAEANIGYRLIRTAAGMTVEQVVVDERMAEEQPVWVINRNSDSEYLTAQVIRRDHPEWESGGAIVIRPPHQNARTKGKASRSLVLHDFTMLRHYDSWLAGASEMMIKIGALEDFTATTEAEMKLYSPFVTDMLVVVRRKELGKTIPLETVLVADYTEQMTHCAFMVTEDDGGTQKSWNCKAFVRVASKSYGIELSIPLNEWDDIVWRGQLDQAYIKAHNNVPGRFGDVRMTFGIEEIGI